MESNHFKPNDLEYESDPERDKKIDAAGPYHQRGTGLMPSLGYFCGESRHGIYGLTDLAW